MIKLSKENLKAILEFIDNKMDKEKNYGARCLKDYIKQAIKIIEDTEGEIEIYVEIL